MARLAEPALRAVKPAQHGFSPVEPQEMADKLTRLWALIEQRLFELLTAGTVSLAQKRGYEKLELAMRQYEKLRRLRSEDQQNAPPAEPDADELAAILDKIDRRIDELANERFKKLADGQFHADAMENGGAGMDV